jgi:hypothetical protein
MFEFFEGASPALWLWVLGVVILGAALAYGVVRAGWLRRRERAQLDQNTRARQHSEDPKKRSAASPAKGTDKPWERPGQLSQNPNAKEPKKPDLEKWKESETH